MRRRYSYYHHFDKKKLGGISWRYGIFPDEIFIIFQRPGFLWHFQKSLSL
jgi:hypothetical protein